MRALWVFVSSKAYQGHLGSDMTKGPSEGDKNCQRLAGSNESVVEPGRWSAILSGAMTPASERIDIRGPVMLVPKSEMMDGVLVAEGASSFWEAEELPHAIDRIETGDAVVDSARAWTGTAWNRDDAFEVGGDCGNWKKRADPYEGSIGRPIEKGRGRFSYREGALNGTRECQTPARLYCISGE